MKESVISSGQTLLFILDEIRSYARLSSQSGHERNSNVKRTDGH